MPFRLAYWVRTAVLAGAAFAALPAHAEKFNNTYEGVVEPARRWNVAAPIDGYIEKISFTEGQLVQKDDVLVQFKPTVAELQLEIAKANLERAQVSYEEAQEDLGRKAELRDREAVSISAYSDAALIAELARVGVLEAELNLKLAEENLKAHTLHAPADGLISAPQVYEGSNFIAEVSGPIATILQLDPIHVRVSLSVERAVRRLLAGKFDLEAVKNAKFSLTLPGGQEFPTRLDRGHRNRVGPRNGTGHRIAGIREPRATASPRHSGQNHGRSGLTASAGCVGHRV